MAEFVTLEEATDDQLARAAQLYLAIGAWSVRTGSNRPYGWPFDPATWQPSADLLVNCSRAKGYLDYLLIRSGPRPGEVPVSLSAHRSTDDHEG